MITCTPSPPGPGGYYPAARAGADDQFELEEVNLKTRGPQATLPGSGRGAAAGTGARRSS